MVTNLQAAQELSHKIKRHLCTLPDASKAIAELEDAAAIAALLLLMTDTLLTSLDSRDVQGAVKSIHHLGRKLSRLLARLPIETPIALENVLIAAHQALILHGFAPPVGKKVVS